MLGVSMEPTSSAVTSGSTATIGVALSVAGGLSVAEAIVIPTTRMCDDARMRRQESGKSTARRRELYVGAWEREVDPGRCAGGTAALIMDPVGD